MKPLKQKCIALIVFLLILLTGCAKDTEAPTIIKVTVAESVVSIEVTDNVGVVGYLLSGNEDTPNLESSNWQASNTFETIKNGSYFVWVKDKAGNVTMHTDKVVVDVASEYEKNFDLINWLKAPVDQDLKQKYGDLYRMVEPLTEEEIENRFEFLVWFSEEKNNDVFNGAFGENSGLYCPRKCLDIATPAIFNFNEKMATTKDQYLSKFSEYFIYSKVTGL